MNNTEKTTITIEPNTIKKMKSVISKIAWTHDKPTFHIEISGQSCRAVFWNQDFKSYLSIPAIVNSPTDCAIEFPADKIKTAFSKSTKGNLIVISHNKYQAAELTINNVSSNIHSLYTDATCGPQKESIETDAMQTIHLDTDSINAIKKSLYALPKKDHRKILMNVSLQSKQDGKLDLWATDGKKLSARTLDNPQAKKGFNTLIRKEIAEIMTTSKTEWTVRDFQGEETKQTVIKSDCGLIRFEISDNCGKYPDVNAVIPSREKDRLKCTFNTQSMLDACKGIIDSGMNQVCLAFRESEVLFLACTGAVLDKDSKVNCRIEAKTEFRPLNDDEVNPGDFDALLFDPKFMVETMKNIDSEKTVLSSFSPQSPCSFFEQRDDSAGQKIVMPLKPAIESMKELSRAMEDFGFSID